MVSLDVLAHVATATLEETADVGGFVVEESQPDVEYIIEGGQVTLCLNEFVSIGCGVHHQRRPYDALGLRLNE